MNKTVSDNIGLALEKISSDPELIRELSRQKTFDELYNFCISVHGGYKKEEFDEYMDDLVSLLEEEALNSRVNEDELRNISGGFNSNLYKKSLAYSLAFLTLATSVSPAAYGADAGATVSDVKTEVSGKRIIKKKSFWQRHKKAIIGTGIFAILAGILCYYNRGRLSNFFRKDSSNGSPPAQPPGDSNPSNSSLEDTTGTVSPPAQPPGDDDQPVNSNSAGQLANPQGGNGSKKEEVSPPNTSGQVSKEDNEEQVTKTAPFSVTLSAYRWVDSKVDFLIKNYSVIGKLLFGAAVFGVLIDKCGAIARSISYISSAKWPISNMIEGFRSWAKYLENNLNKKPVELGESIDNLEYLFDEVKGQQKAKDEVRSIVFNILHRKKHAELTGKPYGHGDVLYFYGPSRVGKTLMARGLAKYKILSPNTEPYYISASEVDKDSRKDTILDQLFGMNNYGGYGGFGGYDFYGGNNQNVISKPKNLVKYISENPNGIVIIDEYDKMWSPALDEVMRTIVDNGIINVKGQTINCSGITFILTSNESTQSIKGGNQDVEKDVDDGTGSRTYIKHDKSFLNRIRPVEFENLAADDYEQIIRKEFKRDLIDYWINPEVCGLDVLIGNKAIKDMAKAVEKKNQGASFISDLMADLFRDISIKVYQADLKEKDYYRGKRMFVDFDAENNSFILNDEADMAQRPQIQEKGSVVSSEAIDMSRTSRAQDVN